MITTTYKVRRIPRSTPVSYGVYETETSWAGRETTRWNTVYSTRAEAEEQMSIAERLEKPEWK